MHPISALRPPLLLVPFLSFARSGSLQLHRGGGGGKGSGKERRWRQKGREERRGKGPAYTGNDGKSLRTKTKSGSLSPLSVVIKEIGEDPTHALFTLRPPPTAVVEEKKTQKRTIKEGLAGCLRLSHSETQEETEPCLCAAVQLQQSAARLPPLCEDSATGLFLGRLNE
ncbi:hypothetical protein EXN66_Car015571 [Channa argus]|uniref:Uncharacterized protein n=1 Tax=Channa argus TaxID=215402 RepID=A0A6G1QBT5_CHAAH|nr:hypothetical protein EXN66_Car015571 [Channa argus]